MLKECIFRNFLNNFLDFRKVFPPPPPKNHGYALAMQGHWFAIRYLILVGDKLNFLQQFISFRGTVPHISWLRLCTTSGMDAWFFQWQGASNVFGSIFDIWDKILLFGESPEILGTPPKVWIKVIKNMSVQKVFEKFKNFPKTSKEKGEPKIYPPPHRYLCGGGLRPPHSVQISKIYPWNVRAKPLFPFDHMPITMELHSLDYIYKIETGREP